MAKCYNMSHLQLSICHNSSGPIKKVASDLWNWLIISSKTVNLFTSPLLAKKGQLSKSEIEWLDWPKFILLTVTVCRFLITTRKIFFPLFIYRHLLLFLVFISPVVELKLWCTLTTCRYSVSKKGLSPLAWMDCGYGTLHPFRFDKTCSLCGCACVCVMLNSLEKRFKNGQHQISYRAG